MTRWKKLLDLVLRGASDQSIAFDDLCSLLRRFGFEERINGDHHIYTRSDVVEIINLQPKGTSAKPYQVKQVRKIIIRYRLARETND